MALTARLPATRTRAPRAARRAPRCAAAVLEAAQEVKAAHTSGAQAVRCAALTVAL
jgi:hypothetical protein